MSLRPVWCAIPRVYKARSCAEHLFVISFRQERPLTRPVACFASLCQSSEPHGLVRLPGPNRQPERKPHVLGDSC